MSRKTQTENNIEEIKPIASQEVFEKLILDNQNFAYSFGGI